MLKLFFCFSLFRKEKNVKIILIVLFPSLPLSISDKWSPALQIRTVLLSIQALLSAPNPDDPLANDVADMWKVDEAHAISIGMYICIKFLLILKD